MSAPNILVVDNFDSFVFNLVNYLNELGAKTTVIRNDELGTINFSDFDGILISPGPGHPSESAGTLDAISYSTKNSLPLLGICLGHQAIGETFGGTVDRAPELLHGKISHIHHNQDGIFKDIPQDYVATRYHSLAIKEENFPAELEVTARSESGVIMGVRHKTLPIQGVQFHPESILTEHGHKLLQNWLDGIKR
ncbi:MAG: anthranilate synthase component II [Candidatus Nanopelagicaceae bacterium]